MSIVQAAVLGLVQGITEFVPVSSSAHLALFPWLLKWPDQGLAYDVALHWGTIIALLIYFREDLKKLITATLRGGEQRQLALGLVLATVPGALAGLLAEDYIETIFRQPERIALSLIVFGILLGIADRVGRKKLELTAIDWRFCLAIGCAQALAVVPGVSRSGITLTAALFLGLRRYDAARFSFLLAIPIVLGAGVLQLKDLSASGLDAAFWTGIAVSTLSGYAAIHFLLDYLKKSSLIIFAGYRVVLGILIILLALLR
ncbi:MAG: undecaprenyl-diphosphatase UppP [Elusimicrobiota bacterium]